jgi:hypothetical protein
VASLATRVGHRTTQTELARLLRLAGHDVEPPGQPVGPWAPALAGRWQDAAAAWETLGCRYERAVELAVAPDAGANQQGHRELADLGATATLAALP